MDVIIFCGGKGTRMGQETTEKPKPMIEIGGKPILWHIMKIYSQYNFNRFILPLGYKGEIIEKWFKDNPQDWDIEFIDTGLETLKGGRLKRVEKYVNTNEFHLTYGDGVSDINLTDLIKFHRENAGIATVTAVRPPSRFGALEISGNLVREFQEKSQMQRGYINGGFFIFSKEIFKYINSSENCDLEYGPLSDISKEKKLFAYKHHGFWQCMDGIREKEYLEKLCVEKKFIWLGDNV
ncbi:MAG: glucose-1-phosphate cytidylyltransferase [Chloroflexi bacterium]|nr:glucose-1-phosphate cytidylyltransferase [Chloroflexota bacterium]|tara:strand:- start:645 stop:1355 length:711 start_codon:yes stop_codon:yes gene_type:complete